jgi:gelsolin
MLKPKEYKLEDSNAAMLGSKEDRATRKKSAEGEPAWKDAGKKVGIEIWRIEKFKVKAWPREQYGSFYSGDSYIVLNTYKEQGKDALKWDLHFWLGQHTTQDEAGTAAYKTVELDTYLDDGPVQHREVMGHESVLFLSYFPNYRTMDGGVDSGFKHVEPEKYTPRLLHLKGKKKIRTMQVTLSVDSLNSGDVFILDGGLTVYKWEGKSSGMFEKNKAREVCDAIKTERRGKVNVVSLREGESLDTDAKKFFELLGVKDTSSLKIKTASEGGSDEEAEKEIAKTRRLCKLSDASGKLEFSLVAEGNAIKKSQLDANDVFIYDGGAEVFAWVGKGASDQERTSALGFASTYLTKYNRPIWLPITRVLDGSESPRFYESIGGN